jgi:transcriptional regulator with XRE-family HTH domain
MTTKAARRCVARAFREARKKSGKHRDEIAGIFGHQAPWLDKIERGETRVSFFVELLVLAAILDIDLNQVAREVRQKQRKSLKAD